MSKVKVKPIKLCSQISQKLCDIERKVKVEAYKLWKQITVRDREKVSVEDT